MSRDLGLSLANLCAVATSNAEGLFNDNVIPYRATTGRTWPRYLPDVIVIVFDFDFADPRGLLRPGVPPHRELSAQSRHERSDPHLLPDEPVTGQRREAGRLPRQVA